MTDTSLFYVSRVTAASAYRFAPRPTFGSALRPYAASRTATTPAMPRTTTMDAETSGQKEVDRRWGGWMVAAQAGDRAAYEILLRDCVPFIRRIARGQGVRPGSIDDVVQETLLTIHQARQTYDPSRSFSAWLAIIAKRRAIDGLRRSGKTGTREVYAPVAYENHSDPSGDPEEAASEVDHIKMLNSALGTLSAAQREAVEHLALDHQSIEQAAKASGRSPGSLRVDWHRALKSLRAQLRRKD